MATDTGSSDIEELHRLACIENKPTYVDPTSGLHVFTADALRARGKCCGCGCRHCIQAFPETGLAASKKCDAAGPAGPLMLHGNLDDLDDVVDILFWSGGKDSYLALRTLAREAPGPASVLLLTTYDARSRTVAHQEVPVADVTRQAAALRLALLGVPLGGDDYAVHLRRAIDHVRAQGIRIARIAFGDLHLAHIRAWRDEHLADVAPAGAELYYPLWRRCYAELRRELETSGVTARICAVARQDMCRGTVAVGDLFDGHLAKRLPSDVDPFGENGEFHSIVEVWEDDPHVLPWNTSSKDQPSTTAPAGELLPCDRALLL